MTVEEQVLAAADALVEAFASHDTAAYFAAFAPEPTFVFHTHPEPLSSRAAYEELWSRWEREDGFRVLSCRTGERRVSVLTDDVAVLTHRVHTLVRAAGVEETLDERETIVFRRDGSGRWRAVHEHLSPTPADPA